MKNKKKLLVDDAENNMQNWVDEESDEITDSQADPQEQFLNPPTKKKQKKVEKETKSVEDPNWNEEITLIPEEYEELDDGSGLESEAPEKEIEPDFNLGEIKDNSEGKFQLSINFDGEQKSTVDEEEKEERSYDPDKPRAIDWIFDIVEMFVFVLAGVLILTSFFFKHSIVKGDSMCQTLNDGDHLIISDLFYNIPDYGDIIVFEDFSKDDDFKIAVIKRVIARPGDTVEIKVSDDGRSLVVLVNDLVITEDYAYYMPDIEPQPFEKITVGEGQVFVLGDNRFNSKDSRMVGTIDVDCILGKVLFRFYPFDKFGAVNTSGEN